LLADPKPRKRVRASQAEWSDLHLHFSTDLCWLCGQAWDSLHHIIGRGRGGDDVIENLAPVCGNGTMGCHGLLEARNAWARSELRRALRPQNLRYLERKLGPCWLAWLDRKYPVAA
jgi:hypothetical protein